MCDGPYKSRKSNRKKHTRVLKFDFSSKEVPRILTGDPNAPVGGLGPPIPPLYSCKNLRVVWKRPRRRFLVLNPDFTEKRSSPLQKPTESTHFLGKNLNQKSPLKSKTRPKVQSSVLLRQAPGLRIRKRGSVAGPGIKIRAKVAKLIPTFKQNFLICGIVT